MMNTDTGSNEPTSEQPRRETFKAPGNSRMTTIVGVVGIGVLALTFPSRRQDTRLTDTIVPVEQLASSPTFWGHRDMLRGNVLFDMKELVAANLQNAEQKLEGTNTLTFTSEFSLKNTMSDAAGLLYVRNYALFCNDDPAHTITYSVHADRDPINPGRGTVTISRGNGKFTVHTLNSSVPNLWESSLNEANPKEPNVQIVGVVESCLDINPTLSN